MAPSPVTLVFAGGGTGGHILPALAIAEQARRLDPTARFRFLCSTRPLDIEILSREGVADEPVSFAGLPARPLGLSPRALLRFVGSWGGAVRAARGELRAALATGPVVLAAMGGFVAAPAAQAARAERVPLLLVNLDAVPGKANRWIARHARRTLTAAALAPGHERAWEVVAPIVRDHPAWHASPGESRELLGLSRDEPTLLVTGGSQGAGTLNALALDLARGGALRGWQVVHQTGREGVDEARGVYVGAGVRARVEPFFSPVAPCWRGASLAMARAGAGSVADAWRAGVPTIFLPYPFHADQHQAHNAASLVRGGGALVLTDRVAPERNRREVMPEIARLLGDGPRRESMARALAGLGPADGASKVAAALLALAAQTA